MGQQIAFLYKLFPSHGSNEYKIVARIVMQSFINNIWNRTNFSRRIYHAYRKVDNFQRITIVKNCRYPLISFHSFFFSGNIFINVLESSSIQR